MSKSFMKRQFAQLMVRNWFIIKISEKIAALQQREKELLEKKSLKDIDVSDKKKEADKITEEINSLKVIALLKIDW